MVEIEIVRRPRRIRRRRDVTLALVATTSVLAAALVVVQSSDLSRSTDRPPGLAIGGPVIGVDVPDAPLAAIAAIAAVEAPSTGDEPTGPSGAVPAAGAAGRSADATGPVGVGGAGSATTPADGAVPGVTPYDDGSVPDEPQDPMLPADDDGPLTRAVDPVLRDLGSTAPVVEPVVEPVRQVARALTGCVDATVLSLRVTEVPGCLRRG